MTSSNKKKTHFLCFHGDTDKFLHRSFPLLNWTILYRAGAPRSLGALTVNSTVGHRTGTQASLEGLRLLLLWHASYTIIHSCCTQAATDGFLLAGHLAEYLLPAVLNGEGKRFATSLITCHHHLHTHQPHTMEYHCAFIYFFTFGGDFEGDLDVFFGILFSPTVEGIFSPSLFGGDGLFGCLEAELTLEAAVLEGPAS